MTSADLPISFEAALIKEDLPTWTPPSPVTANFLHNLGEFTELTK